MKILTVDQIRSLDAATIQQEGITSIGLMERACEAFTQWYTARFDQSKKIGIVCGTGNNGGDGLGIARLLREQGYGVKVWIIKGNSETRDFKTNFERLPTDVAVSDFAEAPILFADRSVLIDAILGSGLSRPTEGLVAKAIDKINSHECTRIAVDIPSGLFADKHSSGTIVKAHHTVTFQLPRLAFLFPENYQYVGQWHLVDIGLSKSFIKSAESTYHFLTRKSSKKIVAPRSIFDHKGDHGRALLIAGGYGKTGAAVLSAKGCLRAGIGLLTVHIPKTGYSILQTAVPEAMASVDENDQYFTSVPDLEVFDVIGIGPGIGQAKETVAAFRKVLLSGKPMVIDADGLNIMSANSELLHTIPPGSILTPHPKEFERMVGTWKDDFERLQKQIRLARETKTVIILKGAHTSVATPRGEVYFNSTGNPGMATGGSGDVLTGILTALLAQKYAAEEAAVLGVYLHGLAGDFGAREKGMHSLIASDLAEYLPMAFKYLI